jgi:hypothetical protein
VLYIPKITSTIKTSDESDIFKVEYKISRSKVFQASSKSLSSQEQDMTFQERSVLEFDYSYTGQNVDVLEFDMKMEMGLAFFQTIVASANIPTTPNTMAGGNGTTAVNSSTQQGRRYLKNTPIMPPYTSVDASTAHSINPQQHANYKQALAKHAFLESIGVKIKTVGNPNILDKVIITSSEDFDGTDLYTTPSLVKVNVRMPVKNPHAGQDYSEPFWYDGLYRIIEVRNIFASDGTFQQELEMYAISDDPSVPPAPRKDGDQYGDIVADERIFNTGGGFS